jgi:phenylalanyl-tRNA synthetase beta subunit
MRCFPGSFINSNLELIVHRESNEYFLLNDCNTGEDIVAKSLEWLSRAAAKGQPYDSEKDNHTFRKLMRDGLNKFWGTDFTADDFMKIYQHLGNRVNHKETIRFIRSNMNLEIWED